MLSVFKHIAIIYLHWFLGKHFILFYIIALNYIFVSKYSSNDLILYCDNVPPSLKWLPWPKDDGKKIVSLAFKSTSEKLLICGKYTIYTLFHNDVYSLFKNNESLIITYQLGLINENVNLFLLL